jgi:hypothetical protein
VKSPDTKVHVLDVHYFPKKVIALLGENVLINMFDNVIAEKSYKRLLIFTRTNKLFPVRNNPPFNHLINFRNVIWATL